MFKARKAGKHKNIHWKIYLVSCGYRVSDACVINKGFRVSDIRLCVYAFLPNNYMEQEGNKHHFNLQPAMSHIPCNYMKQEYLSPIFKQKLQ